MPRTQIIIKTPDQLEDELLNSKANLNVIYGNIDEAKKDLKILEDQIKEAQKEASNGQSIKEETGKILVQHAEAKATLQDLRNQVVNTDSEHKIALEKHNGEVANLIMQANGVKASITQLESQRQKLQDDILLHESKKTSLESDHALLSDRISKAGLEVNDCEKKMTKSRQDFTMLSSEIEGLKSEKQKLEWDNINLNLTAEAHKANIGELSGQLDALKAEHAKTIGAFEAGYGVQKKALDDKLIELQKREGDLSISEDFLAKKTEKLRKYKAELELFYNKKFDNLNI